LKEDFFISEDSICEDEAKSRPFDARAPVSKTPTTWRKKKTINKHGKIKRESMAK
jgi:hypothetical protein